MTILMNLTLVAGLALGSQAPVSQAPVQEAPDPSVLELALTGYERLVEDGDVPPGSLLTIIDYSWASTRRRLFVFDPAKEEVLLASLVAHGKNSGEDLAVRFGNEPGSLRSSLGFFVTGETYHGSHGYTLRLRGLEPGINDNAEERYIVIHGASYVSDEFAERHGRIGRSWGCPALPEDTASEIIDMIKGRTCVFVHGTDPTYSQKSEFVEIKKP